MIDLLMILKIKFKNLNNKAILKLMESPKELIASGNKLV